MASEPTSWAKAALSKIDFTWPENGHASLDAAYDAANGKS